MAGEDGELLEEGGVIGADVDPDGRLLQPLVAAQVAAPLISEVKLSQQTRLASLDVFRGLSIGLMILVDNAGGIWPSINHSPWNGVTLADFVMPFFLFIVGVALALAYKRIANRRVASQKALGRTIKLLFWGLILQGGYYHGLNDLSYGVDLDKIRWCGVLQRIALAYFIVALCEIWAPQGSRQNTPSDTLEVFKVYYFHWIVAASVMLLYLALLYGVYVPDWNFVSTSTFSNSTLLHVKCGVWGDIGPACNAVGYFDRTLMGQSHLYQRPMYRRTPSCSINSPDYGPLPIHAPDWCKAPFDPEGLLRYSNPRAFWLCGPFSLLVMHFLFLNAATKILCSVAAVGSCFLGLHFGHVLVYHKDHSARLWDWLVASVALLAVGILLNLAGMPFNKPLYSFSYVCFTGGAAGIVFMAFYTLVDMYGWRFPTILLEWLGQNALVMYGLVACGVLPAMLQGCYWKTPENNLINWIVHHGPWHKEGITQHRILGILTDFTH